MVQGVTKLITTFQILSPKTKITLMELTKNGVDFSYLGCVRFLKKGEKKSNMLEKSHFSHFDYKKI